MKTAPAAIHRFEAAGLGKAPFKWVGVSEQRGPIKRTINGIEVEVGSAGQPMGTCAFCGTGIAECHSIKSADGKTFIVGSDCVLKTGDKGLKKEVSRLRTEAAGRRADARIEATLNKWTPNDGSALDAKMQELTGKQLGWFVFVQKRGGRSGMLKVTRVIEQALAALEQKGA